jgi:nucleoside-diphosphate-sugar epimerase
MKVLVIGGTLFIGRRLVEELVKAGHDVAVLHRKPRHDFGRRVENLTADRNDADSMREALAGRRFDAVYDNVYDWEHGTTAQQPLAPDYHPDPYVRHKATTERLLFRMHQRDGLPVVTFRPPFVYGPGNPFYREQFFWDRMRAGRPIIIPGDGYRLMQFVYVNDLVLASGGRSLQHRGVEAADAGGGGG